MLVNEIKKLLPKASVKYVHKDEDPRDYKVDFSKINRVLGYSISKKVPDGIKEVITLLSKNMLRDPYSNVYQNI